MTDEIWKLSDDICNLVFDAAELNNRYHWEARYDGEDDLPTAREVESIRARADCIKQRGQLMGWFALACRQLTQEEFGTARFSEKWDSMHRWAVALVTDRMVAGKLSFIECAERQEWYAGSWLAWGRDAVERLVGDLRAEATLAIEWAQQRAVPLEGKGALPKSIPPEYRTLAKSKQKAAGYLRGGNPDSAVAWLNKCIDDGTISCESLSRQSHVFDVRQFPEGVQANILPNQ